MSGNQMVHFKLLALQASSHPGKISSLHFKSLSDSVLAMLVCLFGVTPSTIHRHKSP